jgi:hypothetical protein
MRSSPRIGAAVLAALLGGCTTIETATLDDTLAAQLRGQSVAIVTPEPATFSVGLTHAIALGPLGIPEMIEEGQRLVKENHIVDPAQDLATVLGDALAGRRGAVMLPAHAVAARDDPAAIVSAAPPAARYVLAVQTVSWGVGNLPMPRSNYFVAYVARARLIDAWTKKVVAEAGCMQPPDGTEFNGAYARLTANNAELVKTELAARADRCIHFLERDLLGL